MAHFAEVKNGIVERVLVTDNNDPNGDEGYAWLVANFGGTWVKTSYNTYAGQHLRGGQPLRKNYAGIGYVYDAERDAFYAPQPFPSFILNEETCIWEAPIPYPEDGKKYLWDESVVNWVEVQGE